MLLKSIGGTPQLRRRLHTSAQGVPWESELQPPALDATTAAGLDALCHHGTCADGTLPTRRQTMHWRGGSQATAADVDCW